MPPFVSGFLLPFQSIGLLFKPGVRLYVILPLLLNITLFVLLAWLATHYFDAFMDLYLPENTWLDFLRPVLWVVFVLFYLLLLFYGFTIIANMLCAPFNAILSERVERYLTGKKLTSVEDQNFFITIKNTLSSEFNKLAYFVLRAFPLFVLFIVAFFIPGLNIIVSALWMAFGFWFLALEYADYPMGNRNIKPQRQRRLLAQRRFKSLGFGVGVSAMLLIPVMGFIAMPSAVAGATRYWVENLQDAANP